MNNFKVVDAETKGEVTITIDTQYNNIKATKVIITEDVTARLYGDIMEKLILKKGARLYLHGTVHGEIENEGGELYLFK
ncbi:MAG: hypothetical protein ACXVO9_05815 [Bacteroidia bacterium]